MNNPFRPIPPDAYGAFPPSTILSIHRHRAERRTHICSECFGLIHLGERYTCVTYKDDGTDKFYQYKTHLFCPYQLMTDEWRMK